MTHTLKKTLSIVISLLLIISTFAMADFSAFAKSKDFEYYPGDNNGIMVASYKGNKAKLTIPKKIGNKKVTVLSGINNNKVKEITIGENIIHIEDFAFMDAKELEKITVNKNNKNYSSKNGILYDKKGTKLIAYPSAKVGKKFTAPKKVKSIGNNAFINNKYLESVNISTAKNVGAGIFFNCKKLKSVKLPLTLTKLSSYNFVDYPNGFFGNCKSLKSYTIPKNIKILGDMCFAGSGLKEITIPKTVKKVGKGMFFNCKKLSKVTIKANIKELKDYANLPGAYDEKYYGFFENCTKLTSVKAPSVQKADSRTYIGTPLEMYL